MIARIKDFIFNSPSFPLYILVIFFLVLFISVFTTIYQTHKNEEEQSIKICNRYYPSMPTEDCLFFMKRDSTRVTPMIMPIPVRIGK